MTIDSRAHDAAISRVDPVRQRRQARTERVLGCPAGSTRVLSGTRLKSEGESDDSAGG
jgi:hypothetical protein